MALFETRQRRSVGRAVVPSGYEALADALAYDGNATAAGHEIGRNAAAVGAPLHDVLDDVARTYAATSAGDPDFDVVRTVAAAWADGSLQFLHRVSCEDPLTGLASLSHVRTRVVEIYREAERRGVSASLHFAMVVVEVDTCARGGSPFDQVLRLVDIAEAVRSVYDGDETAGKLTGHRCMALVRREAEIGDQVLALRGLLDRWCRQGGVPTRVWIEGLPSTVDAAERLLDELAR